MIPILSQTLDPFERFREIYLALGSGPRWWTEGSWLCFAAQAAVLRPVAPAETARTIHALADELAQHAHWYEALASPLNLVAAAILAQGNESADDFIADLESAHHLFRDHGFHLSGMHAVKAVLVLHVLSHYTPVTESVILRMTSIYAQLKLQHWWLTGGDDVPVCALLASCPGAPEEIVGIAGGAYDLLREKDFLFGHHLRTAANILTLCGLPATVTTQRFCALAECLRAQRPKLWTDQYDSIALLCLLDHDPQRVVTRIDEVTSKLIGLVPVQFAEVTFSVAIDLVFLDLVRFDPQMRPHTDIEGMDHIRSLIRMQRAASLLPMNNPVLPVIAGAIGWPLAGTR